MALMNRCLYTQTPLTTMVSDMALELNTDRVKCYRCGKVYKKPTGNFKTSYAACHKGVGYLPVCNECVESLYNIYFSYCNNSKDAVRQICRKFDLYWNEAVFDTVEAKCGPTSIVFMYLQRLTNAKYAGKSYDDTLAEEGTMWLSGATGAQPVAEKREAKRPAGPDEVDEDVIAFWGPGYSAEMYNMLEQRRAYWMSRLPSDVELDVGTEALIRQICPLELDINRKRAAGQNVEQSINALNTLLGSANLKPNQKRDDDSAANDNTPFGVWIKRWEDQRPIPEPDPQLKDVDGIVRYIEIWFKGHLAKMLGLKNAYSRMYQDEIDKLRVERPEYSEEEDEDLFDLIFSDDDTITGGDGNESE